MKDIYLFSGLGADKRAFQRLDLSGYRTTFIEWITPERDESIEAYAKRLLSQIKTDRPVLIGVSFGGMMAVEVAKQIETEKIILISSAKSKKEIPFYFWITGALRLYRLLPSHVLKKPNFVFHWLFGIYTKSEKELLREIIKDTDPVFLFWAIRKIAFWSNQTNHKNLLHIHGTGDRILPFRFTKADFIIEDGGHFMILNRADELTKILRSLI
jgi:pimeloyl-ACP methyl ester carboxylesterase